MGDYMNENCISRIINKEVINVRDGSRVGRICDVYVDWKCGNITTLIVPVVKSIFSFFGKKKEYCINWCNVIRVGEDIVLIDTDVRNCIRVCEEEEK